MSDVQHVKEGTSYDSQDQKSVLVVCPEGTRVVSGGAQISGNIAEIALVTSAPVIGPFGESGWNAVAREVGNGTTEIWALDVHAFCAKPPE